MRQCMQEHVLEADEDATFSVYVTNATYSSDNILTPLSTKLVVDDPDRQPQSLLWQNNGFVRAQNPKATRSERKSTYYVL